MDSVSQLLLGASVSMAVAGGKLPLRQAALVGAVCGTLPDLDILIDHGDAIRNMTLHRTGSHSLFWLTLFSPLAAGLVTLCKRQPALFGRCWLVVWLALITHPLLDVFTVYGTQLGLPFTDRPFGIGSIFIIDPLFTLPLLVGCVSALWLRNARGLRYNACGMMLAGLYLAWSVVAQSWVSEQVTQQLAAAGEKPAPLLVTPTAFNTLQWRLVRLQGNEYGEAYFSLLDRHKPLVFKRYPRDMALYARLKGNWYVDRIAWFSHGFFSIGLLHGRVQITDLRMGEAPQYPFTFDLGPAPLQNSSIRPSRLPSDRFPLAHAWRKLMSRF
ncbi:hydrolase [Erwinia sp. OLTSP20]|uniref:metal-dependent hydrolase n=1 Tax=unclassified Erwinia TaxID=2622719 RepID=UPI000C18ADDF|nr:MULTISPECIES: metal-dependent hydrolase [unclassified Erwinia]PIJ51371.1 hydrolase [Erwinia sp. OAMSP11]PIJ74155.1 hydrolase [Erwinia sp. OLSSP12]PIJ81555.1 hydrolase [Erwinia sp. OLCASP19]PIJ86118.1 hydrolase [Erwinia sp. OLMTSP26]PIJ87866.1 hydrolase [Erwinia sp. OLMDSP33]